MYYDAPNPPTEELPLIEGPARPAPRHGSLSRFRNLVEAVRHHEEIASRAGVPKRPRDHELYRRLRELESALPLRPDASQNGNGDGHVTYRAERNRFQYRGH